MDSKNKEMETKEWVVIQLELKYCERCGGLFLRRQGLGEVYCSNCNEQIAKGWAIRKSRSRPRLPVNLGGSRLLEMVSRAGGEGGNA
jgi:ribosomal protein L37AE/L43A